MFLSIIIAYKCVDYRLIRLCTKLLYILTILLLFSIIQIYYAFSIFFFKPFINSLRFLDYMINFFRKSIIKYFFPEKIRAKEKTYN